MENDASSGDLPAEQEVSRGARVVRDRFSSRRRLRAALRAREIAPERGIDRYSGINS